MTGRRQQIMQRFVAAGVSLAVTVSLSVCSASAQPSNSIAWPDPLFDQKKDTLPRIDAATLEVNDKNQSAAFSGNVQMVQGDSTLKCQSLVVYYARELHAPALLKGARFIRRMEMRGGVSVMTSDQIASGDLGVYDSQTKTITLIGNVVVSPKDGDR
jgi:lipopolysaccharide export system protein LptA